MVEQKPSKFMTGVRIPSSAPLKNAIDYLRERNIYAIDAGNIFVLTPFVNPITVWQLYRRQVECEGIVKC